MALRDKLRERVGPQLEPGEQIQQVFLAQQGPNPYLQFLTYLVFFWAKMWIVAVTDRRILFVQSSVWVPTKPKRNGDTKTLPRTTRFGPTSGLWATLEVGGEKYFVNKRFHKDVQGADGNAA